MKSKIYFTGSPICGQCGRFLRPELVRTAAGVPTGQLILRGHEPSCALFGLVATITLPSSEVIHVVSETSTTG